jgi:Pentapeptide repeats (8 copies)/Protein of unknown function (DUF2934)
MDAYHRLSQLSSTVKERASSVWQAAVERGLQWLVPRWRLTAGVILIIGLVAGLAPWSRSGELWKWYKGDKGPSEAISPLLTLAAGVAVAGVALVRHFAQTDADRQRRITESFSKAVEQLGSEKLEVRLGGIYSLERISKENPDDYWAVMETLTAFVRARSQRNERERTAVGLEERISKRAYFLWEENYRPQGADFRHKAEELEKLGEPPTTDIAAVLTVIKRRSEGSRQREVANAWCLDLSGAILKRANLLDAHLEHASLVGAHLEGANLWGAHLEGANLWGAHLEEAGLWSAHLEGANLWEVHLEGANFIGAIDLSAAQLAGAHAHGDARTQLPAGCARPAHWPPPASDATAPPSGTA